MSMNMSMNMNMNTGTDRDRDMGIIKPSLSHRQANFEIIFRIHATAADKICTNLHHPCGGGGGGGFQNK